MATEEISNITALGWESLHHISFYAFWILHYMDCIIMRKKGKMKINQSTKMSGCFSRGFLNTDRKKMKKKYSKNMFDSEGLRHTFAR